MDRQKNSSLWHLLCLALLLCMAALVIATGVTYARYRTDTEAELLFEIRKPTELIIGTVLVDGDGNEKFSSEGTPEWKIEGNTATLEMAVSNGIPGDFEQNIRTSFAEKDQEIKIRIIGGLGLSVGEDAEKVKLKITENGAEKTFDAKAEKIVEGTALHFEHGDGWMFSFYEKNGEEFSEILEGGKVSYIKMSVTVDITDIDKENSLLIEPLIFTETVS